MPDNVTAADLCKLEVQVVRGLLSGEIPAREATAVAQIFNLLHRHLPTADLEKRIALLEETSGRVSAPIDGNQCHVSENHAQDSPDADISNAEASNIGNDKEGEAE